MREVCDEMLSTEVLLPAGRQSAGPGYESVERLRSTLGYYGANALRYAAATAEIDTSERIAQFTALLPAGGRVLDAGCGGGRDLLQFHSKGLSAVGLDLSPELAEIARSRSGCEVFVGDLQSPPPLGFFDGVWAMASLLHIDRSRIDSTLSALASMLTPNGVFFSSVKRGMGDVSDDTGRWFTLYGETQWANHLRDAGFDVIEITGEPPTTDSSTGTVAPGWISSLARRL